MITANEAREILSSGLVLHFERISARIRDASMKGRSEISIFLSWEKGEVTYNQGYFIMNTLKELGYEIERNPLTKDGILLSIKWGLPPSAGGQ